MSVENPIKNQEVLVNEKLSSLEGNGEIYVEKKDRIQELCMNLSGKETFVATKLIENICMGNDGAKKMILSFDESMLPENIENV